MPRNASRRLHATRWGPPHRSHRRWQPPGQQGFNAGRQLPGVDGVAAGASAGDVEAQTKPHGPVAQTVAWAVAYVLVISAGLTIGGAIGLILALYMGLITIAC